MSVTISAYKRCSCRLYVQLCVRCSRLIYVICVCLCIVVSNTYCVVFFNLFVFVLCLVYPMLPVSLDCIFLIAPSVFSNVYLHIIIEKKTDIMQFSSYLFTQFNKMFIILASVCIIRGSC